MSGARQGRWRYTTLTALFFMALCPGRRIYPRSYPPTSLPGSRRLVTCVGRKFRLYAHLNHEESIMSAEPMLTSDVIGLTKVAPFSRRGFMTASAAVTAGYTLAAGPVRAAVITTNTDGLTVGDVKIKVADGEMPGYFARPKGVTNPPVVLVAMEIFGLHEYIKGVPRRLANLG